MKIMSSSRLWDVIILKRRYVESAQSRWTGAADGDPIGLEVDVHPLRRLATGLGAVDGLVAIATHALGDIVSRLESIDLHAARHGSSSSLPLFLGLVGKSSIAEMRRKAKTA